MIIGYGLTYPERYLKEIKLNPFTRRLLGYIFLSLFPAFVAGPCTAQKVVKKIEPVVYLSAVALGSKAQRPACSHPVIKVSEKNLTPFPKTRKALANLSRYPIKTNQVSLYGGNLETFIKRTFGQAKSGMVKLGFGDQGYKTDDRKRPYSLVHKSEDMVWTYRYGILDIKIKTVVL